MAGTGTKTTISTSSRSRETIIKVRSQCGSPNCFLSTNLAPTQRKYIGTTFWTQRARRQARQNGCFVPASYEVPTRARTLTRTTSPRRSATTMKRGSTVAAVPSIAEIISYSKARLRTTASVDPTSFSSDTVRTFFPAVRKPQRLRPGCSRQSARETQAASCRSPGLRVLVSQRHEHPGFQMDSRSRVAVGNQR